MFVSKLIHQYTKVKHPLAGQLEKPMGVNLKVVRAKFSTLSSAVLVVSAIAWHIQERPHLELKSQPKFHPINFVHGAASFLNF